jgi:ketosteroid isomerase-like protein
MSNVDTIKTAYAAFARADIPAIIDLLDDSVEWSTPMTVPQGGQFSGKDGVMQFFQGIGAAWESLPLQVEAVGALNDDLVVAVVRGSGELRSGGPGSYGATHVFTVRNGKITKFREYTDLDKALTS